MRVFRQSGCERTDYRSRFGGLADQQVVGLQLVEDVDEARAPESDRAASWFCDRPSFQ